MPIREPKFMQKTQPELEGIDLTNAPGLDGVFHVIDEDGHYHLAVHESKIDQVSEFCKRLAKRSDSRNRDFFFFSGDGDWVVPLCELRAENKLHVKEDLVLYLVDRFPAYMKANYGPEGSQEVLMAIIKNLGAVKRMWRK